MEPNPVTTWIKNIDMTKNAIKKAQIRSCFSVGNHIMYET
jgi:hypothetical protein